MDKYVLNNDIHNTNSRLEGPKPQCKGWENRLVQIAAPGADHYWKTMAEGNGAACAKGDFPGGLPTRSTSAAKGGNTRRDFLSLMGFSVAAASLAACRGPVQYAVPMLVGSDQIVPGVASWYATTCGGCPSACSLLVKQCDGRPIKIEGNDRSTLFGGGTCATGQAALLSLYDNERLRGPLWKGRPARWQEVDERIMAALRTGQDDNRGLVLLSGTINSPSTLAIVNTWRRRYPNFRHVVYETMSLSAMRASNADSFGRAVIPHYSFDQARVIVGLEADFLGTWLSPVEFTRQYAVARRDPNTRALHVQFESHLSVTGSNADLRIPVAPSDLGALAVALLRRVSRRAGLNGVPDGPDVVPDPQKLDKLADELWGHRGASLVVSGVADKSVQIVVNTLNAILGNIGQTVDLLHPSLQRSGDDAAMEQLVEEMNRGLIHTLILYRVNPGYNYWDAPRFVAGMKRVELSISFSDRRDETSSQAHAICPDHHFLESWGDAEPVESHFSLAQPLIAPLFDTRAAQESLLRWIGNDSKHYDYLRGFWRENLFPRQKEVAAFDEFWDRSLQGGVAVLPARSARESPHLRGEWQTAAKKVLEEHNQAAALRCEDRYELCLYETIALRDGRHANNPWLQELPDPVTKATWGNYAAIAPAVSRKLSLNDGDVILLEASGARVELPVLVQPGQERRTIGVAVGYGRWQVGKVGQSVGTNIFPLAYVVDGVQRYSRQGVTIEKTGRHEAIASTQSHFSMEGRPIVLETGMADLQKEAEGEPEAGGKLPTLWAAQPSGEHSWGMVVDLDACTGCSACVLACQAENNVPVVGKDQVERIRIMHWIRIDHYYAGSEENPQSLYQPMMCQHCGNAPCETVCPVLATTRSSEGINQQVYNRCIGTRYCANNCPYKVRRFNWYNYTQDPAFDYNMANPVGRLVLNPDVVVRSRGVMEKCSLCVQRIQSAKNTALKENRELTDGDIQTACQQACPAQAIVFGDLKDPNSRASRLRRNRRFYEVLEDLGTRPNVGYLKKVRRSWEPS
jgi:Fe-S-cluster-containing dehydrogenase component/anaerobic selenocysteine-containing dehydrogenase